MPGDPRECRQHAVRCAGLAVNVNDVEFKAAYLALSKQWEMFAVELEGAEAMLSELNKNVENDHTSQ
jgi:Tfp pilus assembly PilM family ATPase